MNTSRAYKEITWSVQCDECRDWSYFEGELKKNSKVFCSHCKSAIIVTKVVDNINK